MTSELKDLLDQLQGYPHVLVTGPQRSGTRIAATILAQELEYDLAEEDAVEVDNLWRLFELYTQRTNIVVQAPGLAAYCHLVPDAVVFMRRPLEQIHASEARIEWPRQSEQMEQARYFRTDTPPAELKYWAWDAFQKDYFDFDWFELDYSALEAHPLWVARQERKEFVWDQTRPDGEPRA